MFAALYALSGRLHLFASNPFGWLSQHDTKIGPQANEFCLITAADGTDAPKLHVHNRAGGNERDFDPVSDFNLRPCVVTEGDPDGFFASGLWKTVLVGSVAAAAILFVVAIAKGAAKMMGGQGQGLGQAVKSVLPLLMFAAFFGVIATLPIVLIPILGRIITLIFDAVNSILQ